ncbi:hypothetical protein FNV43_RR12571 [Rhamnella rubrinervis]|uniref:ABC transmembrane type-1 domain-containing protein n=1 Tax=Rhamnella rubrinervis TaxID=2594499 RepID=A0A8K0H7Z1_9ROSA|nr:hypothetical protein FNV43_RR12571 [Rhamnella rubrinervis]
MINIIQHYNFAYMGEFLTKRVRERLLSKIFTFEVRWFDTNENSSGITCSRLSKDANMVKSLVVDRMSLLLQSFVAVIIAWTMSLVTWRLALVVIATQPLIIICIYTRRVLLKTMSKKAIKAQNESCKLASEAVFNLRTITAFSSQDRILKMLQNAQDGPRRESILQSWFAGAALACQHIALVSQEPILFSGTIRENIAYGASKEISEIDIIEAAKIAKRL